ncbi:MAG: alpha/beta fold hydrolase [Chloroflexi bacterium]|nr:MAG: alpha/beta fold hydrolase [Chloroflexota bacterium]
MLWGVLGSLALYVFAVLLVYHLLTKVYARCSAHPEDVDNTPAYFLREGFDTQPFRIQQYEEVRFSSREQGINLSAWYIPVTTPDAPAIIITHGIQDCKRRPFVLAAAGMLHRHGFHVLAIDLRNHGDSDAPDGRQSAGTREYLDVLGAWDWLIAEKNIQPNKIGLMGFSFGAACSNIAFGMEPRVAAVWSDSSWSTLESIVKAELKRVHVPTWVGNGALWFARHIARRDITAISPADALSHHANRPVFIVHGDADERVPYVCAYEIADVIQRSGGSVQPWIVHGSAHIEAIWDDTKVYEQNLVNFFRMALCPALEQGN